jgi:hypothetical protein
MSALKNHERIEWTCRLEIVFRIDEEEEARNYFARVTTA